MTPLSYISAGCTTNLQMKQTLSPEELLPWYEPGYHWARQCCDFEEDLARDVVQDSFLKVLEGRAKFNGSSSLKTWLFSIIRNTAIDHRRKMMRPIPMPEVDTDETVKETYHEALIKSLPARQSEVLILVFYHDQTLEQCAEVMDISIGSVRTHYDRGKKKLKELITQRTLKSHG